MSTQREIRDAPIRQWILNYLRRCSKPKTTAEITKRLNHVRYYHEIRRALEDLVKSGQLRHGPPGPRRAGTYLVARMPK